MVMLRMSALPGGTNSLLQKSDLILIVSGISATLAGFGAVVYLRRRNHRLRFLFVCLSQVFRRLGDNAKPWLACTFWFHSSSLKFSVSPVPVTRRVKSVAISCKSFYDAIDEPRPRRRDSVVPRRWFAGPAIASSPSRNTHRSLPCNGGGKTLHFVVC